MATKPTPFVDDLEDLKPAVTAQTPAPTPTSPAPPQQTPAPAPVPPTQPTATASADIEDIPAGGAPAGKTAVKPAHADSQDVSFGDERIMSRSDGLDILRPDKGKTVRFALLTNYVSAKYAHNHYIEKKGTYYCLSPETKDAVCCEKLKESQPQIVALVLHYTNANPKTGGYERDKTTGQFPPIQWELKFVRLSRSAFRRVSNLNEEEGQITDINIAMSHRDSGIGYEYNKKSAARWKKNPGLVAEVEAAVKPFADGKKLLAKLGKKISLLEFKAILAGTQPSNEDADMASIDDI